MRPLQFGVTLHDHNLTQDGYVLYGSTGGKECFLMGERGDIIHQWRLPGKSNCYSQLQENGNILVTLIEGPKIKGLAAGAGRIVELDPSSNIVWDYTDHMQHHDFCQAPSGNVVYLAWELTPTKEAKRIKGGMPDSDHPDGGIYEDVLREVNRKGEVVWEWRLKDHFPYDKYPLRPTSKRHEYAHANTCHVQRDGNILVSFRQLDLMILINRQTNQIDWEMSDRSWGGQHDCQQLENGNIIVFANGSEQYTPEHSRILDIDRDSKEVVWQYTGQPKITFFSPRISGLCRLANGNTFIVEGNHGRLFEVTKSGDICWEYISPFFNDIPVHGTVNWVFRARKYSKGNTKLNNLLANLGI